MCCSSPSDWAAGGHGQAGGGEAAVYRGAAAGEQGGDAGEQRDAGRPPHADTLDSIYDTGDLLRHLGKLEEARPLLEEALQGQRETLGDRDTYTLSSISGLAHLLKEMVQLEEARPLYEERLQADREIDGDRDPDTLTSIYLLAILYWRSRASSSKRSPSIRSGWRGVGAAPRHGASGDSWCGQGPDLHLGREAGQQEEAEALADRHGLAGEDEESDDEESDDEESDDVHEESDDEESDEDEE
jgi:tetratricopeptide (TPR) repeat protein